MSLTIDAVIARVVHARSTLPESVRLIAVTKQVPVELMRAAYRAGIRDFGESRIQEAIAKQLELSDLTDLTWHFIGHLQTNKALKALEHFQWIHSVDNLKLAQHLNRLAQELQQRPQICLQVKILPDPQKYGWAPSELLIDLPILNQCTHLNICGLMTIPPLGLTPTEIQGVFQQTRELATKIQQHSGSHLRMQQLSMGMSDDYQLAVAAGATMVRLGRVLFGERQY
jgi:hypothetical protein